MAKVLLNGWLNGVKSRYTIVNDPVFDELMKYGK